MIDEEMIKAQTSVAAHEIDDSGIWRSSDGSMSSDIYDIVFDIPDNVTERYNLKVGEDRDVLTVLPAATYHKECPNCEKKTAEEVLLIMLEDFHIYVGRCCDKMIWMPNKSNKQWERRQR